MDPRGRSCPLAYQYQPEALAQPAQLEADTLYVAGGLYGNPAALQAVLERAADEPGGPATIVFNGDFHWLDIDPEDFQAVQRGGPGPQRHQGQRRRLLQELRRQLHHPTRFQEVVDQPVTPAA